MGKYNFKNPENPWKDTEIEIQWFPNKQST